MKNYPLNNDFNINILQEINGKNLTLLVIRNDWLIIEVNEAIRKPLALMNIITDKLTKDNFVDIIELCRNSNLSIIKLDILSISGSFEAIELHLAGQQNNLVALYKNTKIFAETCQFEINLRPFHQFSNSKKLAVFDMDSTLIQVEVIVELGKFANVGQEVSNITEAAMRGELNFSQSFAKRIALLEGLKESTLKQIRQKLSFTQGVETMAKILKENNYKLAVLSGGFQYFADFVKEYLNFDYAFANHLDIKNGCVTGKTKGAIIDGQRKAELLVEIATKENIPLNQVIAIGDGANDLLMMAKASIGVAFHAKPIVKSQALTNISHYGLDTLPYILGIKNE